MTTFTTFILWASLRAGAPPVAVVPYQTLGTEPAELNRVAAALREQVQKHGWAVVDPVEAEKQQRSAVMCGEDAACLATVGQRTGAKWVLAFSMGRVGGAVLLSALLVDTGSGRKQAASTEQVEALPAELGGLAGRLVDPLFRDVPPATSLIPELPPPPPPLVVAEPARKLRPFAVGTAIGAGALGLGGGVLTALAASSYPNLKTTNAGQRAAADSNQRTLNLAADLTVGVALAVAATSAFLFLFDGPAEAPK